MPSAPCAEEDNDFVPERKRSRPSYHRSVIPALLLARRWGIAFGVLVVIVAASAAYGLDPGLPPGANFNLSHWKLTLPDTNVTEISAAQLAAGYTNVDYFYTGPDGAMTFNCPVTGGVTANTSYPRCELREMLNPNDYSVNWTGFGRNILIAICAVDQIPSNPVVIIGQIHSFTGKAYPLVKLEYNAGAIKALVKKSPTSDSDADYDLYDFGNLLPGNLISYQISLNNGVLYLMVNGSNHVVNVFENKAAWANQTFYFKAGDYVQDNSGSDTNFGTVAFYSLIVRHLPPAVPTPVAVVKPVATPEGQFSFNVPMQGTGLYFVQSSTNLKTWKYVLITNSVAGLINFTGAPAGPACFYRAGFVALNQLPP